jgi:hypothetical protein
MKKLNSEKARFESRNDERVRNKNKQKNIKRTEKQRTRKKLFHILTFVTPSLSLDWPCALSGWWAPKHQEDDAVIAAFERGTTTLDSDVRMCLPSLLLFLFRWPHRIETTLV